VVPTAAPSWGLEVAVSVSERYLLLPALRDWGPWEHFEAGVLSGQRTDFHSSGCCAYRLLVTLLMLLPHRGIGRVTYKLDRRLTSLTVMTIVLCLCFLVLLVDTKACVFEGRGGVEGDGCLSILAVLFLGW